MGSSLGFASYTAFCYLLASMALQSLWSLGLAFLDGYALKANKNLTSPILVSLFLVGDWVTALLSFAASCSACGVVILFKRDVLFCRSNEVSFPGLQRRVSLLEDTAISLLPYFPCPNNEDFHEELLVLIALFCLYYHVEELDQVIPLDAKSGPTGLAKVATEEKMKGCLLMSLRV